MKITILIYKSIKKVINILLNIWNKTFTKIIFAGNGVNHHGFRTGGIPYIMVEKGASGINIGKHFAIILIKFLITLPVYSYIFDFLCKYTINRIHFKPLKKTFTIKPNFI